MAHFAECKPVSSPAARTANPTRARAQRRPVRPFQQAVLQRVLQLKAAERAGAEPASAAQRRGGLPVRLKTGVESLSGLAMDDVRVHRDSGEPAKLGARAYTMGSDIHLGPGQERHLPHEAWHVVQQKLGRVRPTMQLKGAAINDSAALEQEADLMGSRALAMDSAAAGPLPVMRRLPAGGGAIVQRLIKVAGKSRTPEAWQEKLDPDASDEARSHALREALAEFDDREFATEDDFIRAVAAETAKREPLHRIAIVRRAELARESKVGATREPEQARMASPFGKYTSVSPSSAHHSLKLIRTMAASAAAKPYGFSFVDKDVEAGDVRDINLFMSHILKGVPPDSPVAVRYGPATHRGAKDGMIQFTLHGRTYSTHADSSQLFPVEGEGIVSGLGPGAMLAALKRMKLLDLPTYYAITRYDGKPWKQAGNKVQQDVTAEYNAYVK